MISPSEGIKRLCDGNVRYVSGDTHIGDLNIEESLKSLVSGQTPFAVILGCADSRVPLEIIFDQGLGDLFVIRVAGNIAGPIQIGSIEYAVQVLGTRLVVVLGHTRCGAVQATVAEIDKPTPNLSAGLSAIVNSIKPAVNALPPEKQNLPEAEKIDAAVRENVDQTVVALQEKSDIINRLAQSGELKVVGAIYDLATGTVNFCGR